MRSLISNLLFVYVFIATGCGGGGSDTPNTTYNITGSVSGLESGTLVLQVSGKPDVSITTNGTVSLATGLSNGVSYTVAVKSQPDDSICTITNGTGAISNANVSNVSITCVTTTAVTLSFSSPASNALIPLDDVATVTLAFTNTEADHLTWTIVASSISANAVITPTTSTATTADAAFSASVAGDYALRVTSLGDPAQEATINLRVHQVYSAMDAYSQRVTFLQEDGTIRSETSGAPSGTFSAIAQGYQWGAAVKSDGTVMSWGPEMSAPVPTDLADVKQVQAGAYYGVAIKNDGTLAVWGETNSSAVLPPSLTTTAFIAVDAANGDIAAIQEDGSMVIWQGNSGNIKANPATWAGKNFIQLCATTWHFVALDDEGEVYSHNSAGNDNHPAMDTVPTTSAPASSIHCGSHAAALIQSDGRVLVWGEELGPDGEFDSSTISDFPRVKDVVLQPHDNLVFLTEEGALIRTDLELVTVVDSL